MKGPDYTAEELLSRLVAFDTTSHKSNMGLVRFVEDYLVQHGVAVRLVPTADGLKAGLFATIGPAGISGIGLSGHTDVVPVDGQAWDSDPFKVIERDGRFYGRGTSDMKGYLACVLAAVPDFKRRKLKTPIHIIFSYDEETGCHGVAPDDRRNGPRGAASAHGVRRRADVDDRRRRAQGPSAVASGCHWPRRAFEHGAFGRQRDHVCRAAHRGTR